MGKKELHKVDSEVMNQINRRVILQLIRQKRTISRADLVKLTGLAAPTVSRIVDKLVHEENLARYCGVGHSNGGRPPVLVEFNGSEKFVLGIDIGATLIRGVLANLDADIVMEIQIPTGKEEGYEAVVNNVVSVVERLMNRRGVDADTVSGLGVGVAGLLSKNKEVLQVSPDFGWTNVSLKQDIKQRVPIPVFLENSTRLMALGEKAYGAGKDLKNFIVINVGYGIAAGLVIAGEVGDGGHGFSGEFGHMTIQPDSDITCDCGRKGCLEALASGRRIELAAREKLPADSLLNTLSGDNPARIDAKMVFEAYKNGDPFAASICTDAMQSLSVGIANLIHLLDPTHVFIGGGVSLNGEPFWNFMQQELRERILVPNRDVKLVPATFKEYATVIGSMAMVLDEMLGLEIR